MKKIWSMLILSIIIFCSCAAPSTASDSAETQSQDLPAEASLQGSDNQIAIVIDNVSRYDMLPDDIIEGISNRYPPGSSKKVPTPDEGNDFICVYLTITQIENVHISDPLGYNDEGSIVLDTHNHEYVKFAGSMGIVFTDVHDINSPIEAVEGSTGYFVFEMPKDEEPSVFRFVYSYKKTWEEQSAQRGQIDIAF